MLHSFSSSSTRDPQRTFIALTLIASMIGVYFLTSRLARADDNVAPAPTETVTITETSVVAPVVPVESAVEATPAVEGEAVVTEVTTGDLSIPVETNPFGQALSPEDAALSGGEASMSVSEGQATVMPVDTLQGAVAPEAETPPIAASEEAAIDSDDMSRLAPHVPSCSFLSLAEEGSPDGTPFQFFTYSLPRSTPGHYMFVIEQTDGKQVLGGHFDMKMIDGVYRLVDACDQPIQNNLFRTFEPLTAPAAKVMIAQVPDWNRIPYWDYKSYIMEGTVTGLSHITQVKFQAIDFLGAHGQFQLATPTNDGFVEPEKDMETGGGWLYDDSSGLRVPSVMLPDAMGTGYRYGLWYNDGTKDFFLGHSYTMAEMDDFQGFSGPGETPEFLGEDLLNGPGFPRDMSAGGMLYVTAEPVSEGGHDPTEGSPNRVLTVLRANTTGLSAKTMHDFEYSYNLVHGWINWSVVE